MDSNRRPAGYEPAAIDQLSYVAIFKTYICGATSPSHLRFVLVVYVFVHSRQQSHVLLALLASIHFEERGISGGAEIPKIWLRGRDSNLATSGL